MKWWAKKKQQFVESMVEDAVGVVQNHTQKTVSDTKKKLEQLLPIMSLGCMIFGDLSALPSVLKASSAVSSGSNFTLYIENVNVTFHQH